ncbi:MAG: alpha-ketoglutarate-dependent dioxygenase AlkB family protein [Gammaproteobacteria bacterium]
MDLFASPGVLTPIPLPDATLAYLAQLPLPMSNEAVFEQLLAETAWRAESITLWGRRIPQPRLTAWHGEASYTYSGLKLDPAPFTPLQLTIKQAVETVTGLSFNSVLLNLYRNERDSMGMHSDNEPELGPEPAIASVSFGTTRTFILKHRHTKQTLKVDLAAGSLLLMAQKTQAFWLHGINKSSRAVGPRINLTFRKIS